MSTPSPGSNPKNTAIKRIQADVRELSRNPSNRYYAEPLEDNMFEWHFTIRGPSNTDFQSGLYHGRILLPADYPFKPPNFIFLTENGRFEVGTKVCLSISAHHPEAWQPAWGVRTMLEAIISFLPTEAHGAIGGLEWSPEERRKLAEASHSFICPHCGEIKDIIPEVSQEDEILNTEISSQVSQLHMHNVAPTTPNSTPGGTPNATRHSSFVGDSESTPSPAMSPTRPLDKTTTCSGTEQTSIHSGDTLMNNVENIGAGDNAISSSSSSSSLNQNLEDDDATLPTQNEIENRDTVNTNIDASPNGGESVNDGTTSTVHESVSMNTNTNVEARPTWAVRNGVDGCLAFIQYLSGILAFLLLLRRLLVVFAPNYFWPEYPFNPELIRLLERIIFEDDPTLPSSSAADVPPTTNGNSAEL